MLKFLTLTFLAACAIPLALADGPTRTFIARAYQSPYPIGQQLSGTYLSASGGSFYVTTAEPPQKAQLSVDSAGKAYLSGNIPIYMNSETAALEYQYGNQKAAAGALYPGFIHAGKYTSFIPPSALFVWALSDNSYWFGSPVTGQPGRYKIYIDNYNTNPLNNATAFQLVAIDT